MAHCIKGALHQIKCNRKPLPAGSLPHNLCNRKMEDTWLWDLAKTIGEAVEDISSTMNDLKIEYKSGPMTIGPQAWASLT